MSKRKKTRERSEEEIDDIVVAQADNDSAWEKTIQVRTAETASVRLPSELAARAAFLARLHREASVENWLKRIIQERVDLEEAAFNGLKRDLAAKKVG